MRSFMAAAAAACLALTPAVAAAGTDPAWQSWHSVPGVFDLGGPRSDGSLVVAGSANLYLADPAGTLSPFARGAGGYHEDPGAEAYLAVSPGAHGRAARCDCVRNDTFLLRLHIPICIERVDPPGQHTGSFANVPCLSSLTG